MEEEEIMEALMSRGLARHQGKKNWKGQFNGSESVSTRFRLLEEGEEKTNKSGCVIRRVFGGFT